MKLWPLVLTIAVPVSANTTMYYPPGNFQVFYIPWPLDLIVYGLAVIGAVAVAWAIWEWFKDLGKKPEG